MANDGGVQAMVDSAKKTLAAVNNSNVSAKQSPYAPKPSYSAARSARKESSGASSTSLSDEAKSAAAGLAAKQKNVSDYAASN